MRRHWRGWVKVSEWVEGIVADLCSSIDYGLTDSAKTEPIGPKFLRITDIVGYHLNWDNVPYVKADAKTATKYSLQDGDIVIARTGATTGESAYIADPPKAVFASYLVRLKTKPDIEPRFLAYWLKSPSFRGYIHGVLGEKSAQPNASAATMTKAPIRYPVLKGEQKAIANVLSSLDDKIENNRRMNEALERQAQAIFKDWFVDFGPTHRKAAVKEQGGETDPVAIMGGLINDAEKATQTAALFSDRFGNNGLPEGWEEGTLEHWATINVESWKTKDHPKQVEYVDLSNTKWGTIESTDILDWADAPSRARRIVRPLDTIVATTRPGNGSYAFISENGLTASTGFAALKPKQNGYSQAVYCAATLTENITRLAQLADGHGGAYPAVKPIEVLASPMPVCPSGVVEYFEALVFPIREKVEQAKAENKTLAETRDYLLPRLMSGQIRARAVEDVAV